MRQAIVLTLVGLLMAGCASTSPTQKGALAGSAIGAGLGAIIGHQSGSTAEGALIGAAAGGLGGALIGDVAANRFCPTCGRKYFSDQTYCPVDNTPLRVAGVTGTAPASTSAAPAQAQSADENLPKFCPTCGRSYPQSAAYCTEDGAALKAKQK